MSRKTAIPPWWRVEVEKEPVDGQLAVAISDGSSVEWLTPAAAREYARQIEAAAEAVAAETETARLTVASYAHLRGLSVEEVRKSIDAGDLPENVRVGELYPGGDTALIVSVTR